MRDYSFRFLDQLGRSQPGEHARFMDDQAATDFARDALARSHSVEVWRGKECVIRVERPTPNMPAPVASPAADPAADPAGEPPINSLPRIVPLQGVIRPVK